MKLEATYSNAVAHDIMKELTKKGYKVNRQSSGGGYHFVSDGVRLEMFDADYNKYEILVKPMTGK